MQLNQKYLLWKIPILTMRKVILDEIIESFEKIGYHVNTPFRLKCRRVRCATKKKKRVFIVGTLIDSKIKPPKKLFSLDDKNLPNPKLFAMLLIGGLPELKTDSGKFEIVSEYKSTSPYESLMMGEIDFQEFYILMKSKP